MSSTPTFEYARIERACTDLVVYCSRHVGSMGTITVTAEMIRDDWHFSEQLSHDGHRWEPLTNPGRYFIGIGADGATGPSKNAQVVHEHVIHQHLKAARNQEI